MTSNSELIDFYQQKIKRKPARRYHRYVKHPVYTIESPTPLKPIKSYEEVMSEFHHRSFHVLEHIDWNGTFIIAGSFIYDLIHDINNPTSDIDIFCWGGLDAINRLVQQIASRFDVLVFMRDVVLTLVVRGIPKNIQIVHSAPMKQFLVNSDIPYTQMCFDGRRFLCTSTCLTTYKRGITWSTSPQVKVYQLYKALHRGLKFIVSKQDILVGDRVYDLSKDNLEEIIEGD